MPVGLGLVLALSRTFCADLRNQIMCPSLIYGLMTMTPQFGQMENGKWQMKCTLEGLALSETGRLGSQGVKIGRLSSQKRMIYKVVIRW